MHQIPIAALLLRVTVDHKAEQDLFFLCGFSSLTE